MILSRPSQSEITNPCKLFIFKNHDVSNRDVTHSYMNSHLEESFCLIYLAEKRTLNFNVFLRKPVTRL